IRGWTEGRSPLPLTRGGGTGGGGCPATRRGGTPGGVSLLARRHMALGRELGYLGGEAGGIALEHQQPDLREHRLDRLHGQGLAVGEQDLLGLGGARALIAVE